MDENLSNKVYLAAQEFRKAIEEMGAHDVVISYAYSKDSTTHTGGTFANRLQAIGGLTLCLNDLIHEGENDN